MPKTVAKKSKKKATKKSGGSQGKKFRILSIDGGGIRGLVPAMILTEIERRSGKPISSMFDLIAGTSTGGILSLGLTIPGTGKKPKYSASALADLYLKEGETIFPRPFWRRFPGAGIVDVFDEKYSASGLERVLKNYFQNAKLSEALTEVMVTAYALERRETFFFKSRSAKTRGPEWDYLVRDAARATSAAPTYFEPAEVRALQRGSSARDVFYALVDGGVFANNPSMCAVAEAMQAHKKKMSDLVLVSLGTGHTNRPIRLAEAKGWGLAGWVRPVLSVMMDGMADSTEYQCGQLLPGSGAGRRYCRIDEPLIDVDDEMDNASPRNLRDLARYTEKVIAKHSKDIDWIVNQVGS